MAKAEASVEELVGMMERGELRLPEMQRRYVWRSTRVRDLLDSLYRGYPSGAILLWETAEAVPLQEFAVQQQNNPFQSTRLLLDGQQRLTSLSAVIRGEQVNVRGRKRPIELLFNLEHPEQLAVVTEVNEDGDDEDDDLIDDEADSNEDELQKRFDRMTFVVATRKLEQLPHWVKVTDVFKSDSDRAFLRRAGVMDLDDPRSEKYSQRLSRLRGVRKYAYRMDVLERTLSYDEVTEIFGREDYQAILEARRIVCSMSRRGNCHDNAVMESFFSTVKSELREHFDSNGEAKMELFDYIEVFYNQRRRHSTLGQISPAAFERRAAA